MKKFPSTDSDSSAKLDTMSVPDAPKASFVTPTGLTGRLGDEPIKTSRSVKVGTFPTDTRISKNFATDPSNDKQTQDLDGAKEMNVPDYSDGSRISTEFSK